MNATKLVVTSFTKDSPGAGQWTAVGTYTEDTSYSIQPQQVTVNNFSETNPAWARFVRTSTEAVFAGRFGSTTVSFDMESLMLAAFTIEPDLTYAPRITTQPSDDSCVASSTAADFTVVAESEAAKTYLWQYETKASSVLTSNNTNVSNNDTVTLGNKTYTFKTALTPTEGEVLIGADADGSLLNLIRAINHTGTPDTDYKCAAAHTQFAAEPSVTSHTITVRALLSGTAANSYATTETAATLSWTSTVAAGGGTWNTATSTVNGCAYTNGTTATLTCTPTTTMQSGTEHRCQVTNVAGTTNTDSATLTIS